MRNWREYQVNPQFKKDVFCDCLSIVNVDHEIVGDSIYYDADQLAQVRPTELPHMLYMNLKYMKAQRELEDMSNGK